MGMVLVLTSKELAAVKEGQQFCKDICGYHNRFDYAGSKGSGKVKYSFTGTMARWVVAVWQRGSMTVLQRGSTTA
jgi:hypothetical protein